STAEPVSQSTTSDYQWDVSRNQPYIDDEWSGLNGLSSADPSSDWNAPAEEWGNWVDEERASLLKSQEPVLNDQRISDDDKEKGEGALPTGKSKKKKKKKKKQGEENSLSQDTEELEKDTREELPLNTSKTRPKQERAFPLKTMSTSDPAEVLVKNSQKMRQRLGELDGELEDEMEDEETPDGEGTRWFLFWAPGKNIIKPLGYQFFDAQDNG
ncbi:hypothetical protein STEG23_035506, partial [Scotinomys teguina]